jgi:hypothetical protein
MSMSMAKRTSRAISLLVLASLLLSLSFSTVHSHRDGCGLHYDCAICLWLLESAAVIVFFLLFMHRMLIYIIRLFERSVCPILITNAENGRAPPHTPSN